MRDAVFPVRWCLARRGELGDTAPWVTSPRGCQRSAASLGPRSPVPGQPCPRDDSRLLSAVRPLPALCLSGSQQPSSGAEESAEDVRGAVGIGLETH